MRVAILLRWRLINVYEGLFVYMCVLCDISVDRKRICCRNFNENDRSIVFAFCIIEQPIAFLFTSRLLLSLRLLEANRWQLLSIFFANERSPWKCFDVKSRVNYFECGFNTNNEKKKIKKQVRSRIIDFPVRRFHPLKLKPR